MENEKKKYQTGFKVPEDYFNSLEDKLFNITSENKLPNTPGFKVPDNYFESLEDTILSKVTFEDPKVISIFKRRNLWYASGIAAAIALLLVFTWNSNTINPNTIEFAEIETYINNDNLDLEMQDIAQVLNDEDLEDLSLETLSISEENIEDYLLDNIDDTTLLIE